MLIFLLVISKFSRFHLWWHCCFIYSRDGDIIRTSDR